jgi:hypothetical protein
MNRSAFVLLLSLVITAALWLGFWAGEPVSMAGVLPSGMKDKSATKQVLATAERPPNADVHMTSLTTQPSGPERIDEWLSSSTDIPTIANKILISFPSLEAKDHLLAAAKLVALVSDDRFEGLKRLLFDPKTSLEAKEFLFRDALSRAETVKLPLLLEIMQMPEHPCANEARETLKTQLGVDYGVNYGQWQVKISEVLKGG